MSEDIPSDERLAAGDRLPNTDRRPHVAFVAAMPPLVVGAAHFNDELASELEKRAATTLVSWKRMYPPYLFGSSEHEEEPKGEQFMLDWLNPLTWQAAAEQIERSGAQAVVIPWLHPIMAPPYLYLLWRLRRLKRVVICHNVEPHEPKPGFRMLTRRVLGRADLLVTHAPQQADQLAELGLGRRPRLELFHPRFVSTDFAPSPPPEDVAEARTRLGDPKLLLLCFGAVRPYKGFDLAIQALARLPDELGVSLLITGRFWHGKDAYEQLVDELGLQERVFLQNRYVENERVAILLTAADGVVLPYRSASQSGVAQLAFAYGTPVIASAVGGLPSAVRDGVDGLLCPPGDVAALAAAIERFAHERERLAAGVQAGPVEHSFGHYAERLLSALS